MAVHRRVGHALRHPPHSTTAGYLTLSLTRCCMNGFRPRNSWFRNGSHGSTEPTIGPQNHESYRGQFTLKSGMRVPSSPPAGRSTARLLASEFRWLTRSLAHTLESSFTATSNQPFWSWTWPVSFGSRTLDSPRLRTKISHGVLRQDSAFHSTVSN